MRALSTVLVFLVLGLPAHAGPFEPNIFVDLAKKVVPSVVNISTLSKLKGGRPPRGTPEDLFRRFFEDFFRNRGGVPPGPNGEEEEGEDVPLGPGPGLPGKPRAMSLGTGFIIDVAGGLILTNNHVVAGADEIKIQFTEELDEKLTDGEVVGRDPDLDLALIKVKTKRNLVALPLGDSDALEVGEYVIAVGNPFGQGHSVTHGIISAKDRQVPDFQFANYIQTDTPINPGNSGGPLVNLKGEVIGINNAIDQRAQGIGFAIPINHVKRVLPQLKTKGSVTRGYIGVLVNELTPELAEKMGVPKETRAPFVTHVYPGEPADKAGVRPYDVIVEFNKKPIRNFAELIGQVTAVNVDASVPIKILRGKESKTLTIKVKERPGQATLAKGPNGNAPPAAKKKDTRPAIGMELEDLTAEDIRDLNLPEKSAGVLVADVEYGGAADRAGFLRGDLILEADRKLIRNVESFYQQVQSKKSSLIRVRRLDPQGREVFTVLVFDLQ
jgi:serine protease Do